MTRSLLGFALLGSLAACDGSSSDGTAEQGTTTTASETTASNESSTSGVAGDTSGVQSTGPSETTGPDETSGGSTGPQPPNGCDPEGKSTLELGHGEMTFEPIDAHPATLVYGVQGGFHIVLGIRATHVDASDEAVLRMTGTIDGEELAYSAPYVDLACVDGMQESVNLLLIWDTTPEMLHNQTAHIVAELTDAAGEVYVTEADVLIDDPNMR